MNLAGNDNDGQRIELLSKEVRCGKPQRDNGQERGEATVEDRMANAANSCLRTLLTGAGMLEKRVADVRRRSKTSQCLRWCAGPPTPHQRLAPA